uniref:Envelope glycoprotein gp160 n=1 Tax=Simian immunodeficiency virus TaxID=11723 RepID=F4N9Q2_SIV|nr:Env protein [Simian immunodeficiency virus]
MRACPGLLIGFTLLLTIWGQQQYVTVFYGTPKWEPAVVPLICASANNSLWITTSCLPDLESYAEVPITGLEENFTEGIRHNQVVQQAWQAMTAMVDSILKPCVKINPYCVRMKCDLPSDKTTTPTTKPSSCDYWTTTVSANNSTANSSTTVKTTTRGDNWTTPTPMPIDSNCTDTDNLEEKNTVCSYNVTGLCRDCTREVKQNFRDTEVTCTNDTCYMTHCNDSVITQDCHKGVMQNAFFRLCAPAGYMLLRCDEKLNTSRKCKNITATPCTEYMISTVSSFFGFNGTRHKEDELIPINNKVGLGLGGEYVWKVAAKWNLVIKCIRKGNRSEVSTISSTGLLFYYGLEPGHKLRLAQCKFEGYWGRAFASLGKLLREVEPKTNMSNECTKQGNKCVYRNGTDFKRMIKFKPMEKHGADAATELLMMTCGEEMFFCNITRILKVWNDTKSNKWYPWANCHIKSVIDDWATVGKKIYLPPTSGFNNRIRCENRVTEAWFTLEKVDWKINGDNISVVAFQPPTNTLNQFVSTGAKYKVIKIKPIGFAPTAEHRYAPRKKEKRAAPLALGALALLSAAGTAMGLVSTILTVQAQAVLQGILQQQKQLLVLVEKQQELLRLTIWGVKNLQARLTALEEYVKDQSILASWGCQWKQVCHTNVPWNFNVTPNWTRDTWIEWEKKVEIYDSNITALLQEAYVTELENQNKFKQLQEFNFWSWLDISSWFWYIKYAVLAIIGIILLRVISFIVQQLVKMCKGYRVLSPSAYVEQDFVWEEANHKPTDKEEGEEAEKEDIYINLEHSKKESLPPPWTVGWDEPLQDSLLVTLLKWLKAWGIVLAQNIYFLGSFLRHLCVTFCQHGQRLWKTLRDWMGPHLVQAARWIRNTCRTSRENISQDQGRNRTFTLKPRWRIRRTGRSRSGIPSETTETLNTTHL